MLNYIKKKVKIFYGFLLRNKKYFLKIFCVVILTILIIKLGVNDSSYPSFSESSLEDSELSASFSEGADNSDDLKKEDSYNDDSNDPDDPDDSNDPDDSSSSSEEGNKPKERESFDKKLSPPLSYEAKKAAEEREKVWKKLAWMQLKKLKKLQKEKEARWKRLAKKRKENNLFVKRLLIAYRQGLAIRAYERVAAERAEKLRKEQIYKEEIKKRVWLIVREILIERAKAGLLKKKKAGGPKEAEGKDKSL